MNEVQKQITEELEVSPEALQQISDSPPNGDAIARICERMAARNALPSIQDPAAWQREIRKDRPLPGRDE